MGVETTVRPRAGFLHRLQCARDGHYWERQLSDDGGQARWVCIRCGKQGDVVPLVSSMAAAEPELDVHEDTLVLAPEPAADERVAADGPVIDTPAPRPVAVDGKPVEEPGPADVLSDQPAMEAAPAPERDLEPPVVAAGTSLVTVAVVSLVVVGGLYLAFRRRRR